MFGWKSESVLAGRMGSKVHLGRALKCFWPKQSSSGVLALVLLKIWQALITTVGNESNELETRC